MAAVVILLMLEFVAMNDSQLKRNNLSNNDTETNKTEV